MCGIVGYVGERLAVDVLLAGLRRLEYRGYDSAGVALASGSRIEVIKAEGKLENVEKLIRNPKKDSVQALQSHCGMGHTRWATHGRASVENAHPHQTGSVVLVHNGIIENYQQIKADLLARGYQPRSETDSELFGYLVLEELKQEQKKTGKPGTLREAARRSFAHIEGQCSLILMSEDEPGVLVALRSGAPLVAALDPLGGALIASDPQPLISYTRSMYFLEPGEMVVASRQGLQFYDIGTGAPVTPQVIEVDWSEDKLSKGGYPHYMLKEIHEQPSVLVDTLNNLVDRTRGGSFELVQQPAMQLLAQAASLTLVACGTSWHAALLGKYWIESLAKIPVTVDLASEFRYRNPVLLPGTVVVGLSQSGETADTLAAVREIKQLGIPTLGVSNVRGSSLSRVADAMFYTDAGVEIGVAATKSFIGQLLVLYLMAGYLGRLRFSAQPDAFLALEANFRDLLKLPHILAHELDEKSALLANIQKTVTAVRQSKGFFFIGRGYSFPIALEGALKLKETAYDYAEGYAAGELKHGPIAMIDFGMVVIVLAPKDQWRDKTVSNLQEVKARGAVIVGVGSAGDDRLCQLCDHWIPLPSELQSLDSRLFPFFLAPIVQLLSYYRAVSLGTDVDQPRNLAKSVTVE